jgi:rare lipoprotein A
MLLNIIRTIALLSFVLFLGGCTKWIDSLGTTTSSRTYHKTYKKVGPQKIRNSKAMHRATMRSYVVGGKRYYPTQARVGDSFHGIASWYGPNFHARKTSNGEIYNMYALTAAHKTLPMNTMVKVFNKANKKSVIVRINDRGPFVNGRIIDLSNKAAHKIDMVKKGTARVRLTILGFNAKIAKTQAQKRQIVSVSKFYVQVGAFRNMQGAISTKRKFELILDDNYKAIIKKGSLNKVRISGFRSYQEAKDFKKENGLKYATIIAQ